MSCIVIHRTKLKDVIEIRNEVFKMLNELFKQHVKLTNESRIELFDTVISFRCGGWDKLAGIRPDYYNAHNHEVLSMLEMSAGKVDGKRFESIDDIPKILAEIYSNKGEINDVDSK